MKVSNVLRNPRINTKETIWPESIQYQKYDATVQGSQSWEVDIKPVYSGAKLLQDVWVEYIVTVDINPNDADILGGNDFREDSANSLINLVGHLNPGAGPPTEPVTLSLPTTRKTVAWNSGFPFAKATDLLEANINGSLITVSPSSYLSELDRIYVSEEQSGVEFGMAGGEFDSGNMSHMIRDDVTVGDYNHITIQEAGIGGALNQLKYLPRSIWGPSMITAAGAANDTFFTAGYGIDNPRWYNTGLDKRNSRFLRMVRKQLDQNNARAAANARSIAGNIFTHTMWERLPVPLFKMYETKDSNRTISNVRSLYIKALFNRNIRKIIMVGQSLVFWNPVITDLKIKVHTQWAISSLPIQPISSIGFTYPKVYSEDSQLTINELIGDNQNFSPIHTKTYGPFNLIGIPDTLLFYIKRDPKHKQWKDNDAMNLEIVAIQIQFQDGRGVNFEMNTVQLYSKWKRYLSKFHDGTSDYERYRKYHCVALLEPQDFGIQGQTGFRRDVQISVTLQTRDWNNVETIGGFVGYNMSREANGIDGVIGYTFYCVQLYEKYQLDLYSDNTSTLQLL